MAGLLIPAKHCKEMKWPLGGDGFKKVMVKSFNGILCSPLTT